MAGALGAGLSACGTTASSTSTTSTTTTTSPSATSVQDQVNSLTDAAKGLKNSTFEATYTLTENDTTKSVTYAQSPPKYLFKLDDGGFALDDGTNSYYCSASKTCVGLSASSPISAELQLFDGTTFTAIAKGYAKVQSVLNLLGVAVTFSDATYAGQASTCMTVTYTRSSKTAEYCVATATGLLTYWRVDTTSYELTGYTDSPPSSDFEVPSDYTTLTLP